jgi:glycosyltransferase involved in cell wall biosynthesis
VNVPQDARRVAFVLKGYPRLSETFIAQEIRSLEKRGLDLVIVSLRRPTDGKRHPVHEEIRAPLLYLPEYLHDAPWRVLKAIAAGARRRHFGRAFRAWLADLRRDVSRNRVRRFGQALVLARELPEGVGALHAHFIHTPASVARYAALLTGLPFSLSAHAKDIWTSPDWDLAGKLAQARWAATCTRAGAQKLAGLADRADKIRLHYHGIDLARFPPPPAPRPPRDGGDPGDPVRFLSVGRAVPKKGYDDLLEALAALPADLHWRFEHVGGGEGLPALRARAERLGLAGRLDWRGAQSQGEVLAALRRADLFVLASKIAGDGDRDGLPNVLMEAQSQALACVSTAVSAIPELIEDGATGRLVAPGDAAALARALAELARDPRRRRELGEAGAARVRGGFEHEACIDALAAEFGLPRRNA